MHATDAIRAFVILPSDMDYGFGPRSALQGSWDLMQRWMDYKSGTHLNFDKTLHFMSGDWTFNEMKDEKDPRGLVYSWWENAGFPATQWPIRGKAAWESGDTYLMMVVGAGGFAGGIPVKASRWIDVGRAIVGDAVVGPLLANSGYPELNTGLHFFDADDWQVQYETAFGTAIHELGHGAFALDHGEESAMAGGVEVTELPESIMIQHWSVDPNDFSKSGYLPLHQRQIQFSKYATIRPAGPAFPLAGTPSATHSATVSFRNPNPVPLYGRMTLEFGNYESGAFEAVATSSVAMMNAGSGNAQDPTQSTDGALSITYPVEDTGLLAKGTFMYGVTDEPVGMEGDLPYGWKHFDFELTMPVQRVT